MLFDGLEGDPPKSKELAALAAKEIFRVTEYERQFDLRCSYNSISVVAYVETCLGELPFSLGLERDAVPAGSNITFPIPLATLSYE